MLWYRWSPTLDAVRPLSSTEWLLLSAGDRELQQARVHRDAVIQPRARIGASAVQRIHLNLSIAKSYHRAVESWRAIPLGSALANGWLRAIVSVGGAFDSGSTAILDDGPATQDSSAHSSR